MIRIGENGRNEIFEIFRKERGGRGEIGAIENLKKSPNFIAVRGPLTRINS